MRNSNRCGVERGAWVEFYSAVAAAVRGVAPLLVDPQDAVDVLGILEAVRTNAKERCVIHF